MLYAIYVSGSKISVGQIEKNQKKINPVRVLPYLKEVDYPCSKADLIAAAQQHGAKKAVIQALKQLDYEYYDSFSSLTEAVDNNIVKYILQTV